MNNARQIAPRIYQRLASWFVLLSLLLFVVVGANQSQPSLSPLGQQDVVSLAGTPEPAAVQVKQNLVQRAADDRLGNPPEALLPFGLSTQVNLELAIAGRSAARFAWSSAPDYRPNAPRAPPVS